MTNETGGVEPADTPLQQGARPAVRRAKRPLRRTLLLLALPFVGAAVGYAAANLGASALPRTDESPWLMLLALPVVILLVFLAHECGHLVAARAVGFRFALLIVGPLEVARRSGSGVRLRLNRNLSLYGGIAGSTPPDDRDLRRRMAVYVAGGPLASLVLGSVALLAALGLPGLFALLLGMFGLISLSIAAATLVPSRLGGLVSDGARLLMLLRGGPAAERWCALAALSGASMGGVRPRDWPESWTLRATSVPDGGLDAAGACLLAYARALDRGDAPGARRLLDRALGRLEELPDALRPSIMLEAAYHTALYGEDPAAAREWLREAKGGMAERHTRLRAEAAVLLAEGRPEEARAKAEKGLELTARSLDAGSAVAERDWIRGILRTAGGVARASGAAGKEKGSEG